MHDVRIADPEVRGTGAYSPPSREQALATVRRELAEATSEERRVELREVLAAIERESGRCR